MTDLTQVAEVIDAHHINIFGAMSMEGFECTCGAWVESRHLAAHQAEMLAAAGLVASPQPPQIATETGPRGANDTGVSNRLDPAPTTAQEGE